MNSILLNQLSLNLTWVLIHIQLPPSEAFFVLILWCSPLHFPTHCLIFFSFAASCISYSLNIRIPWGLIDTWHSLKKKKSVQFSHSVVSDSLRSHDPQCTRPPCPSPTPRAYSNACPLSWWCHPIISSSVVPFSSCLQSFPASGSFQVISFRPMVLNIIYSLMIL